MLAAAAAAADNDDEIDIEIGDASAAHETLEDRRAQCDDMYVFWHRASQAERRATLDRIFESVFRRRPALILELRENARRILQASDAPECRWEQDFVVLLALAIERPLREEYILQGTLARSLSDEAASVSTMPPRPERRSQYVIARVCAGVNAILRHGADPVVVVRALRAEHTTSFDVLCLEVEGPH